MFLAHILGSDKFSLNVRAFLKFWRNPEIQDGSYFKIMMSIQRYMKLYEVPEVQIKARSR